ncbi:MAG: hypothetical protein OIF58_13565 [Cohaesibacter sp.]|nr:hypothetical protein [Cohaesibacter sp.]
MKMHFAWATVLVVACSASSFAQAKDKMSSSLDGTYWKSEAVGTFENFETCIEASHRAAQATLKKAPKGSEGYKWGISSFVKEPASTESGGPVYTILSCTTKSDGKGKIGLLADVFTYVTPNPILGVQKLSYQMKAVKEGLADTDLEVSDLQTYGKQMLSDGKGMFFSSYAGSKLMSKERCVGSLAKAVSHAGMRGSVGSTEVAMLLHGRRGKHLVVSCVPVDAENVVPVYHVLSLTGGNLILVTRMHQNLAGKASLGFRK